MIVFLKNIWLLFYWENKWKLAPWYNFQLKQVWRGNPTSEEVLSQTQCQWGRLQRNCAWTHFSISRPPQCNAVNNAWPQCHDSAPSASSHSHYWCPGARLARFTQCESHWANAKYYWWYAPVSNGRRSKEALRCQNMFCVFLDNRGRAFPSVD